LAVDNRGTKAVLFKNWKEHRELNRSYYFAKAFDYPIALATIPPGRVVVVHCPGSYDTIAIEDAETGEILGTRKSDGMEFHSRLAVSEDGAQVVSAGWFWHPLGGAWLCPVSRICGANNDSENEVAFSFRAEIDSVGFLGSDCLVVSSTDDVVNPEGAPSSLPPLTLGLWSIRESRWLSTAPLEKVTGTIMPWKQWVIAFHERPKAIELATGKVVHVWDDLASGTQVGSIELGTPPPPIMALEPRGGMFAVADDSGISVVSLSAT
jgi:hypothetical protein